MARPGDELVDPFGTRLVFMETAESSGGRAIGLDWRVPEGHRLVSVPHVHPFDREDFEVRTGRARYRVARHVRERDAPFAYGVPPGALHVHPANIGSGVLHVRQSVRREEPSMELFCGVERYFETVFALAQRGGLTRGGSIRDPLQSALTLHDLLFPFSYLPGAPHGAQRAALGRLADVARRRGYTAHVEPERASRAVTGDVIG